MLGDCSDGCCMAGDELSRSVVHLRRLRFSLLGGAPAAPPSPPLVSASALAHMKGPDGTVPRWQVYIVESDAWKWTAAVTEEPRFALGAVAQGLYEGYQSANSGEKTPIGVLDTGPRSAADKPWRTVLGAAAEPLLNPDGFPPQWHVYLLRDNKWVFVAAVMDVLYHDWAVNAVVRRLGMADSKSKKGLFTTRFSATTEVGVLDVIGSEGKPFRVWRVDPEGVVALA